MSGGRGGPSLPNSSKLREVERSFGGGGWSGHGDYMRDKEDKLHDQQRQHVERVSNCMEGVVLHIDGNTAKRSADLIDLVVAHGGRYDTYFRGEYAGITHLMANTLPAAKLKRITAHLQESRRKGKVVHVVTEAWLVDCAQASRRLPESDYPLTALLDPEQNTLRGFVQNAPPQPQQVSQSVVVAPPPPMGRTEGVGGYILHVDVDAYFVQCHQVAEPHLYPRGMPLAVQQHQDVIALNAEAKACGVRKHMLPAEARSKLDAAGGRLVHVPTDCVGRVTYRLYEDCSRRLFALWRRVSAEEASPDAVLEAHASSKEEAWIDIGHRDEARAIAFARTLRWRTLAAEGFAMSIGLARASKACAKLASRAAKVRIAQRLQRDLRRERVAAVPPNALDTSDPSESEEGICVALTDAAIARLLSETAQNGAEGDAEAAEAAMVGGGDDGVVKVRPPRQKLSAHCSLAIERRPGGGRGGADIEPTRMDDEAAQEKWVRSCVVDLLQRAALHRREHGVIPTRLEVEMLLRAAPPSAPAPIDHSGAGERIDDGERRSRTADLDGGVCRAIAKGRLRYSASERTARTQGARARKC